jgi:hypothetical protein
VLVAEAWGETGWSDAGGGFEEPNTNQGVAVRVEL